jgi:hypothetical protein
VTRPGKGAQFAAAAAAVASAAAGIGAALNKEGSTCTTQHGSHGVSGLPASCTATGTQDRLTRPFTPFCAVSEQRQATSSQQPTSSWIGASTRSRQTRLSAPAPNRLGMQPPHPAGTLLYSQHASPLLSGWPWAPPDTHAQYKGCSTHPVSSKVARGRSHCFVVILAF